MPTPENLEAGQHFAYDTPLRHSQDYVTGAVPASAAAVSAGGMTSMGMGSVGINTMSNQVQHGSGNGAQPTLLSRRVSKLTH